MTQKEIDDRINRLRFAPKTGSDKYLKIKTNFEKIKKAHDWFRADEEGKYSSKYHIVMANLDKVYEELAFLGVEKGFSVALFIFGADITRALIEQFDD